MKRSIKLVTAFAALLALTVGIGVAIGAIPASSGQISGCYAKAGGNLRVIDLAKGQSCKDTEKPLSWNQRGPQGAPGPSGIAGREVIHAESGETSDNFKQVIAECPPDKVTIGGGAQIVNEDGSAFSILEVVLNTSAPPSDTRWVGQAHEVTPTAQTWTLRVDLICANAA